MSTFLSFLQQATQRTHWPVCGHSQLDSVLAYTQHGAKTVRDWLHDVHALAQTLPAQHQHILNLCQSRYQFLVGFGACLLSQRISLQPSSLAPKALEQLTQTYPHTVCLHDGLSSDLDTVQQYMPVLNTLKLQAAATVETPVTIPEVASTQVIAHVFTSGSTGTPVAHPKTWGKLCINVLSEAHMLHLTSAQTAIVGTVPSQHMYGFESVILLSLVAGYSVWDQRPFYPADVALALDQVPAPRMLVTTPVHLRNLVESSVDYAKVNQLLCATAPLATTLATQAEQRFACPLYEIYGSTETNQIAVRHSTQTSAWHLFPGVHLTVQGDTAYVQGSYIQGSVALADVVDIQSAQQFQLIGRKSDMVNIAGRRSSLTYLNHQLSHIPGVLDGAFFIPKRSSSHETQSERPCLIVKAPSLSTAQITQALRNVIDSVFLPRPIILVDDLPRNETSKLPLHALQTIYDQWTSQKTTPPPIAQWQVPHDHPVFVGHFPTQPVVPGAMLLDQCLQAWAQQHQLPHFVGDIVSSKFVHPCLPGDTVQFVFEPQKSSPSAQHNTAFKIQRLDGTILALGTFRSNGTHS